MLEPSIRSKNNHQDTPAEEPEHSAARESRRKIQIACAIAFLAAVASMLFYKPLSQAEGGDDAIWDYISQCIVRGQVPYRDVIDNKSPASAYLSALAIVAGKALGLQDILSVRVLYVILVGVLSVVTLITAWAYFRSLAVGAFAVLMLLTWPGLAELMIAGTRPKVPTMIFGLLTLFFIAEEKPLSAGICSMIACLCWQPGLMFTGTAVLLFSKYLTSWRDLRALKVMIGAALPLVITLVYFSVNHALFDFWRWTFTYNLQFYLPEGHEGGTVALKRLWHLIREVTGGNTIWVKLSVAGILFFMAERVTARVAKGVRNSQDLFKEALVIVPLLYVVFKMVSYPGIDDLIPLFPFVGFFSGYAIVRGCQLIASIAIVRRFENAARLVRSIPLLPLLILLTLAVKHGLTYTIGPTNTLQDQQRMVRNIADLLEPDDLIYVHGTLEILVLLNRPNMNPYIFLPRGVDNYIADQRAGSFSEILDEMKSRAPKVISLSRIKNVEHRHEMLAWVAEQYDRFPVEFAHNSVYVLKKRN